MQFVCMCCFGDSRDARVFRLQLSSRHYGQLIRAEGISGRGPNGPQAQSRVFKSARSHARLTVRERGKWGGGTHQYDNDSGGETFSVMTSAAGGFVGFWGRRSARQFFFCALIDLSLFRLTRF